MFRNHYDKARSMATDLNQSQIFNLVGTSISQAPTDPPSLSLVARDFVEHGTKRVVDASTSVWKIYKQTTPIIKVSVWHCDSPYI
jgi:hypothetical protein